MIAGGNVVALERVVESADDDAPMISVVMPCLNEEATIGQCVSKAFVGIEHSGLPGEVIVADNGSTDGSVRIAHEAGAQVIHVPRLGYGNAYLAGFAAARGRYLVMGDSDDTYDFTELSRLVTPLRDDAHDYVLGSRFQGEILPGAMPWLHQYIGNPVLTWVLNRLFGLSVSDAHSGMRAFTRDAYERMRLTSTGMEFASELIVNAAQAGLRVTEVPITYYPRGGESKLRSFRDGWRHLRFMLLRSPDWMFLAPGLLLLLFGLVLIVALTPGPLPFAGHDWDVHALILGCLSTVLGVQVLTMGLSAKAYAYRRWPDVRDGKILTFYRHFTLERGIVLGLAAFVVGFAINAAILWVWLDRNMGPLDAIRPAVAAATLMIVGTQIFFSSFLLSILDIRTEDQIDGYE